jgi:hypothetical protein
MKDIDRVILNRGPLSIVVLGSDKAWQCYVLVHMFRVSYSRKIILGESKPEVDEVGFVYHEITLAEYQHVYNNAQSVMSFALMLPKADQYGQLRLCVIYKDWRIVDDKKEWTVIN